MPETTEDEIRQRDQEVIARLGRPEQDPLLRAEMDRRWLLGEIDRLRSERAVIVAAARRTSDEVGRSIDPSKPIDAEVKVQVGASWLTFAHVLEQEG